MEFELNSFKKVAHHLFVEVAQSDTEGKLCHKHFPPPALENDVLLHQYFATLLSV